jgi:hypothetical protein
MPTKFGVVVILVIGVIINVLVAWGLVIHHRGFSVSMNGIFQQQSVWPHAVPNHWPKTFDDRLDFNDFGCSKSYLFSPSSYLSVPSGDHHIMMITASGFPFHSMHLYRCVREPADSSDWLNNTTKWDATFGMIDCSEFTKAMFSYDPSKGWLPMKPIPLGFAVNTLLYAILAWPFYMLVTSRYRPLFPRSGVCRRCEYDVTGLDRCPECGLKVKQKKKKTQPATQMAGDPL